jgi:hypothetical protein
VVAFLIQGCRRRRLPSIGISPGSHPGVPPRDLRVIPDRTVLVDDGEDPGIAWRCRNGGEHLV